MNHILEERKRIADNIQKSYNPDSLEKGGQGSGRHRLSSKKESYDWGNLAVLSHKNNWKAVLHPEHLNVINKLKSGESHVFTDEQNKGWEVTRHDDNFDIDSKHQEHKGTFHKDDITFEDKK